MIIGPAAFGLRFLGEISAKREEKKEGPLITTLVRGIALQPTYRWVAGRLLTPASCLVA